MEERLINNASFAKICKMLQKKESIWEDVKPILQATIMVIPALVNKEFVALMALHEAFERESVWVDAVECIGNAFVSIKKFVSKQDEDFVTRAENAQIANVLLVFAAFFDTVKIYLPDKEGELCLDEVQYRLTEKSLMSYQEKLQEKQNECIQADGKRIADWNLMLPNPLEGLDEYDKRLKEFYCILRDSFRSYLDGLSCAENMQEHLRGELNRRLDSIPRLAVGSYKEQYYTLAAVCPDFFVWTNQHEHQQQRELVDKGFQSLSMQIQNLPERFNSYIANEALNSLDNWYTSWIKEPIIPVRELPPQDKKMRMPTREKCFVPQAYEWLIYRQPKSIETTYDWKQGGQIGQDILNVLRSPELGSKPLLILGGPGAGKTTLAHMLAGKVLRYEYHVIVVHLRDINAEAAISKQINEAIERTLDDSACKWGNITKAVPPKPILLIFDGYDELLQIKGKTYSNYLEKIVEFQENQWKLRNVMVRSIVTSRIVLIDKVDIPIDTVVFRLKPFDKPRIDAWCNEWNCENEVYFDERGLEKFEVEEGSKAWELAGEPLLLLMLALFDTKDNALRKHQNLQATELYGSLIRDFVEREKKKNPAFEKDEQDDRETVIEDEIERIAIAALGMFNRNVLHITSGQLEKDLELLSDVNSGDDLKDSEMLLGSFFFIHKSTTRPSDIQEKDKLRAYTFLHNTFGEFLAAHYIVIQLFDLLSDLQWHDRNRRKRFSMKERMGWYSCLSYAPLFRRPVVGRMIQEWMPRYFKSKDFEITDAVNGLNELINREMPRLLRGEVISEIKDVSGNFQKDEKQAESDLIEHLAIYSNNLLSITALLTDGVSLEKSETPIPRAWNKLLHLWRYAFDENEIAAFAGFFKIEKKNEGHLLVALDEEMDIKGVNDRAFKLYETYQNLQDEPSRSILGTLLGVAPQKICRSLNEQGISTESKSILLSIILGRNRGSRITGVFAREEIELLRHFPEICLGEGDYSSLYGYYLVLNDIASISEESAKNVELMLNYNELLDVYAHCNRHHPQIVAPILGLIEKMVPIMRFEEFCHILERLISASSVVSQNFNQTYICVANLFLKYFVHADSRGLLPSMRICLKSYWRLLREVEERMEEYMLHFRDEEMQLKFEKYWNFRRDWLDFSHETLEKLCLVNIEARRLDRDFPSSFLITCSRYIVDQFRLGQYGIHHVHDAWDYTSDLLILLITLEVMSEGEGTNVILEEKKILEAVECLLQMPRGREQYDIWKNKPQLVLTICHTVHKLSKKTQKYVLNELKKLVKTLGNKITLELYRELYDIANKLEHPALKAALEQIR